MRNHLFCQLHPTVRSVDPALNILLQLLDALHQKGHLGILRDLVRKRVQFRSAVLDQLRDLSSEAERGGRYDRQWGQAQLEEMRRGAADSRALCTLAFIPGRLSCSMPVSVSVMADLRDVIPSRPSSPPRPFHGSVSEKNRFSRASASCAYSAAIDSTIYHAE